MTLVKDFMKTLFKSSVLLLLISLSSCTQKAAEQKVLKLSIWPNYISEDVIKSFEKDTGIKVEVSNFSANEELYAKLKAGGNVYDLIVPSDYMVEIMANEGLVEELGSGFDKAKANIDANFLGKDFDKTNKFSLPYAWTTTGIAFNKDMVKEPVVSWNAFLTNKALSGKLALLDDGREVIAAALKSKGKSINTTTADDLKLAKAALKDVRARVKLFTSEPYLALSNKEIAIAQIYSSDALQLKREGKLNVDFVIPEEGAPIAIDNFAVPKGAVNKEAAQQFVEYVLSPANYKINFESQLFGPVVKDLSAIVAENLKNDPVLFPQADRVSKLEQMKDLGEKTGDFDRIWTEFKAQ